MAGAAKPDLTTYGVSGLNMMLGVPNDEWHALLVGPLWPKMVREMIDSCPIIGSGLRYISMIARAAKWRVVEADPNDESAVEQAIFLDECINDLDVPFDVFMAQADSMLAYGWAAFEECFKYRRGDGGPSPSLYSDGRIGWRAFAPRAQETRERWEITNGEIQALWQSDPNTGARLRIPYDKLLHFRLDLGKDNPEGRSILRNAFVDYRHRKFTQQYEGIGLQKDTAGNPDMQGPLEYVMATSGPELQVKNAVLEMLRNKSQGHQAYSFRPSERDQNDMPTGWKLEQEKSGGPKAFDTDKIIRRCDHRIALVLGTDVLLLGGDKVGSYSMASSKTSQTGLAIAAINGTKKLTFNRVAVPRLMRLNGWTDPRKWPRIEPGDPEVPDPKEFMAALKELAGVFPDTASDPHVQNVARRVMSLPERTKEEIKQDDHQRGEGEPVDETGKIPLAIQQLALARERAMAVQDTELAGKLGAKIDQLLDRIA